MVLSISAKPGKPYIHPITEHSKKKILAAAQGLRTSPLLTHDSTFLNGLAKVSMIKVTLLHETGNSLAQTSPGDFNGWADDCLPLSRRARPSILHQNLPTKWHRNPANAQKRAYHFWSSPVVPGKAIPLFKGN